MSLIPGGRADKFGNRFERHWVVSLALDVIDGRRLTSIKWEPLGHEGEGIECVAMDRDKIKIYYQCKIQNGNKGGWSMADLKNRNVLQAAKTHLQRDASSKYCFVSDDPARALKDMAGNARHCDFDIEGFLALDYA